MKPLTNIGTLRQHEIGRIFHDSRFWTVVGVVAFVVGFTALVIWASQYGSPNAGPYQPYWPYGPYPMPMR
jgi:hypothetical protein